MINRQKEILRYLENNEFLSASQAIDMFHASPATIRRDFLRLTENNSAKRVQGGVQRIPVGRNASIPFFMREQWFTSEKARLAERAIEFVPEKGTIFIHSGSTTLGMGHHLNDGNVITNSITICELLRNRFPAGGVPEIVLLGGSFDLKAGVTYGSKTDDYLRLATT